MSATLAKPSALAVEPGGIPAELKAQDRWTLWRYTWKGKLKKWDKMPLQVDGKAASTTNPETWGTFAEVYGEYMLNLQRPDAYDGVGFVLGDGWTGVDLDGCRDAESGEFIGWSPGLRKKFNGRVEDAPVLIKELDTYTELSPSETGVKLVGHGALPPSGREMDAPDREHHGLGLYPEKRFFCITGHRVPGTPAEPREFQEALTAIHRAVFGEQKAAANRDTAASNGQHSDDEILKRLFRSKSGDKAKRLLDGDTSGYVSGSEADEAAACHLAFWTRDAEQIARIIRGSRLNREKWDREDYRQRTIGRALENVTEFYQWERFGNSRVKGKSTIPVPMSGIIGTLKALCHDWPRRVENALFAHDPTEGVCWLDGPACLFGWIARNHGIIEWRRGIGYVTRDELFAELARTAPRYDAIEELPHEPPVPGHYYACPNIEPGDGATLRKFLEFFSHESEIDRQLHTAIAATPLWGGPPGARPAAMVTSTTGRGKGKSKTAQFTARFFGGFIDVSANEEIAQVKQRFLTKEALVRRVALLDNVKTLRFSWAELESIITTDFISGKRLYYGEARRPNYFTWIITLNGASLSTDMAQRVVEIKLADPEYSETWEAELSAFIADNRQAILADLIGFLRRPTKRLKRYSRWASWESQVLSKVDAPDECVDAILARRGQVDVEEEEGGIIEDYFAAKLRWLGYDLERDDVFIPNDYATRWYNQATGETRKVTGVARILRQLRDEKKLNRIVPARTGDRQERGFRWVGEYVMGTEQTYYDIRERIRAKLQDAQGGQGGVPF